MTKERPILFSGAMVRAIQDGRKTQTRRPVKPQPTSGIDGWDWSWPTPGRNVTPGTRDYWRDDAKNPLSPCYCPYGKPGDLLWVREAHSIGSDLRGQPILASALVDVPKTHMFGATTVKHPDAPAGSEHWCLQWKRRPSIHMPRWASRITLQITGVRVERLNDCSAEDAIAEGIAPELGGWIDYANPSCQICMNPVDSYRTLWDSINGAGAWKENPWVWVVEFRRA